MTYTYTTQAQVRAAFWQGNEPLRVHGKRQNDYGATLRSEWCEFVDMLARDGLISEALASRITL